MSGGKGKYPEFAGNALSWAMEDLLKMPRRSLGWRRMPA